jgi:hypothetical protein
MNYWSPLTCLVNKQEEEHTLHEKPTIDWAMCAIAHISPANKVTAHWVRKMDNQGARKAGILDTGATLGAAPEEDEEALEDTGMTSSKTFMSQSHQENATQAQASPNGKRNEYSPWTKLYAN